MNMQPAPTRRPRARVAAVVAVLLATVLTGCGVRLETPPPSEPVPDAFEQVRRSAVADALGVAELATTAGHADGLPEPVSAELARIVTDAHTQSDALGGQYVSGLEVDDPEAEPTLEPEAAEPAPATPAEVVVALSDAAGRNRTAANTTSEGDLARLLASIGAAQTVSATRLAALTGAAGPEPVAPVIPAPEDEPEDSEPGASPTAVATTAPGAESARPSGLSASDYSALVEAEDAARYALEVRAAIASDEERARLIARSRVHGERAQGWARLAGVVGTAQDPRRVAYAIPREEDDAVLVRTIQTGLATDYASLVGTTAPMTRGLLIDLLVDTALTLDTWDAPPPAFPGLPEQLAD